MENTVSKQVVFHFLPITDFSDNGALWKKRQEAEKKMFNICRKTRLTLVGVQDKKIRWRRKSAGYYICGTVYIWEKRDKPLDSVKHRTQRIDNVTNS